MAGLHSFYMESANGGASANFKQTEKFTGIISFIMNSFIGAKLLRAQFEEFNGNLKMRAEAAKAGQI